MKIQEASEDLQMGGVLFPKYRDKLFEDEDLKPTENRRLGPGERHHAPRGMEKCLGHGFYIPCAYGIYHAPRACIGVHSHAPCVSVMRPVHAKTWGATVFSCFRVG